MPLCIKCLIEKPSSDFSRGALMMGMFAKCLPCEEEDQLNQQAALSADTVSKAEKQRRWRLKSKYHITSQQYDAILTIQHNQCAICQTSEPGGNGYWQIDFTNDQVHGLLCQKCNIELGGWLNNSVQLVKRILDYLNDPPANQVLNPD